MRGLKMSVKIFFGLILCAFSLYGASWPQPIKVDAQITPIKDMRDSTSAPDLGYAGAMLETSTLIAEWFYISNRVESARLIREAGAWVVRPWGANDLWQRGMAWVKTKDRAAMQKRYKFQPQIDPHAYFSFWKENGMKAILCLENYGVFGDVEKGTRVNDIESVKKVICDYLQWIVDNGYKECVAGFECGNEAYWGNNPEQYGERWSKIIPEMKRIWPDVKIGIPIAEYRPNDPDIAAVRARATGLDWVQGGGEFSFSRLNQWSGRFIVALSNQIHNVSHVIYHFYGGDGAYGCSASGFQRIKNFAKVFPEIADKRVWITEWRERADEDNRCHQTFQSSLWKGHYLLSCLAQPNVDGISLHNLGTLAGGLSIAVNGYWLVQWNPANRDYVDIDYDGKPRIEPGPSAPVFNIYTEAVKKHPLILSHGNCEKQGKDVAIWASALYYGSSTSQMRAEALNQPKSKWPKLMGNVEWVTTMNADKTSLSVLMVNTFNKKMDMPIELSGFEFAGEPRIKSVTIPEKYLYAHLIPGERPLWIIKEEKIKAMSGDKGFLPISSNTVQSITIPIKRK
jgi:hypothetical protein